MDKIQAYTVIILTLRVAGMLFSLASGNKKLPGTTFHQTGLNTLGNTLGILPLVGRVFGWW